jgi:hypothetical protein
LFSGEFLILGVNLIESFFVNEEISVNGNGSNNGTVVENLKLDVLGL